MTDPDSHEALAHHERGPRRVTGCTPALGSPTIGRMSNTVTAVEASDLRPLGFAPGVWPRTVTVEGVTYRRATCSRDREGELQYVRYLAEGRSLVVYND